MEKLPERKGDKVKTTHSMSTTNKGCNFGVKVGLAKSTRFPIDSCLTEAQHTQFELALFQRFSCWEFGESYTPSFSTGVLIYFSTLGTKKTHVDIYI